MSSIKYADKPVEVLQVLLSTYLDKCMQFFGENASDSALACLSNDLEKLFHEKQKQLFEKTFSDLTAKDILELRLLVAKAMEKPAAQDLEPKQKSKKPKG